jgi:1,4-dihydroxy-2-naphthoyl-CoA hydrolase
MFKEGITVEFLNQFCKKSMVENLGIEFTEIGDNYMIARMPVDHRTNQPLGLLHGGASIALAETLGSVAATFVTNTETHYCVGLEINGNHIKAIREGYVFGKTTPIHIGGKTQIWEIRITNEKSQLISICRITMAVLEKRKSDGE